MFGVFADMCIYLLFPLKKIAFLNIQVKCTSSILQVIYLQFQVQTQIHLAVEHSFSFSSFEPAVILQTAEKKQIAHMSIFI